MSEYTTEVMADEMAEERLVEQVEDTCEDWPRYLEPVWALPRDIEVIYTAVVKHGMTLQPWEDAYEYLVRRLERGTDEERAMAIEVLGCIDDTAALWRLRDVARYDQNPKLRARALEVACACFGVHALNIVCDTLTSSTPIVRYTAERMILDFYRNADTEVRQRIFEHLVYRLRDMV